jgi:hypothetical protein
MQTINANTSVVDLIAKVIMAPPQRRTVYVGKRDKSLAVAAVTCTVRLVGGLELTLNVYARSKGIPARITDMAVAATLPTGIAASDKVTGAFLAHVEKHVQGWSGWRDAAFAAFDALANYSDAPKSSATLTVAGFADEAKPQDHAGELPALENADAGEPA